MVIFIVLSLYVGCEYVRAVKAENQKELPFSKQQRYVMEHREVFGVRDTQHSQINCDEIITVPFSAIGITE